MMVVVKLMPLRDKHAYEGLQDANEVKGLL